MPRMEARHFQRSIPAVPEISDALSSGFSLISCVAGLLCNFLLPAYSSPCFRRDGCLPTPAYEAGGIQPRSACSDGTQRAKKAVQLLGD